MGRYQSVACAVLFFLLAEIAETCIEREREALVKFKATLQDPSNRLSSWKGNHCCQWEGIACDNVTAHVVKLDLINPCWRSWIQDDFVSCDVYGQSLKAPNVDDASDLSQLEYLSYLDLSGNDFQGNPIPIFIASMGSLTYLSLSGANFGGRIPSSLGNLTNLHHLDLSWTSFQILSSSDINWISQLGSLEHLDLSGVDLGPAHNLFQVLNTLPSCLLRVYLRDCGIDKLLVPLVNLTTNNNNNNNAPQLQLLDLRGNELTNPSLDAFQNMTSLVHLHLSSNHLNSVPSWLPNFEKLKYLDLSVNGLRGPIPDAFRNMASIEFLSLSLNYLTSVPSWFGDYFKRLVHLYLSDNKLSGRFPTWLGELENLEYLELGFNCFYGPIPFSLGKLSKLKELHLYNTTLDGNLPPSLGELVNLQVLDLSNNYLNGTIPQSLGGLVNLRRLHLSNNYLNGTIPQSLGQLTDLEDLILSGNKLHGSIPDNFDQLANLDRLDLSSNKLDGIISMGKEGSSIMPQLSYLNLSYNHINGPLPKSIGDKMPNLGQLHLGSNLINGSIPNSLCQTQLYNLDLSKNKLSGEIPNCWSDSTQTWEEINLSSNKLSGVFPSTFGNLSSLLWLHLNNNNLQGQLPVSVNDLKRLLLLDLGENQLSGGIPSWTSNTFPSLQILRLRQNKLSGSIPSHLCQLASLKILDLSLNNLEGSIPWCIGNLTGMTLEKSLDKTNINLAPLSLEASESLWPKEDVKQVMKGRELDYFKILKLVVNMDLSKNRLVGFIPNGITLLTGLHGLNLSYNHLEGEIPKMIGDMKSLESFDVSHNQLLGSIPNSMRSLTSLSHPNLSHNNFSGPIPQDNQFSTFDPSVYAGNPYLCGPPLPNKCPGDDSRQVPRSRGYEDEDEDEDEKKGKLETLLFYLVVAVGFATGFWGVIGVLLLKKNWRHAYFRWVEDAADEIYVTTVIKVAKIKRWLVRNRV